MMTMRGTITRGAGRRQDMADGFKVRRGGLTWLVTKVTVTMGRDVRLRPTPSVTVNSTLVFIAEVMAAEVAL